MGRRKKVETLEPPVLEILPGQRLTLTNCKTDSAQVLKVWIKRYVPGSENFIDMVDIEFKDGTIVLTFPEVSQAAMCAYLIADIQHKGLPTRGYYVG